VTHRFLQYRVVLSALISSFSTWKHSAGDVLTRGSPVAHSHCHLVKCSGLLDVSSSTFNFGRVYPQSGHLKRVMVLLS